MRHGGFIPWDDDLDTGMIREDLERFLELLPRYKDVRWTLVYDKFVKCRQVRFKFANESLPCFVDIFIYEWSPNASCELGQHLMDIKHELCEEVDENPAFEEWAKQPYYASDGPLSPQIQGVFDEYIKRSFDENLYCSKEQGGAVCWALDNIVVGPMPWIQFAKDDIFPLQRIDFEGFSALAPAKPINCINKRYENWLDLPDDILSHYHHADLDDILHGEQYAALKTFVESRPDLSQLI